MFKKITIIRHGQSAGNFNKEVYLTTADSEVGLTDLGKKQAKDMTLSMFSLLGFVNSQIHSNSEHNIRIYYSSYVRAYETFKEFRAIAEERFPKIFREATIVEESLIREHEYSQDPVCSDVVKNEIDFMNSKGQSRFYHRFLNGESFADVEQRVVLFLNQLQSSGDSDHVFLFCHGHTQQLLIKRLLNLTVTDFHLLSHLDNCEYTTLYRVRNGNYKLDLKNSNAKNQLVSIDTIFRAKEQTIVN
jgi:broad specificity phosphatase PhoE